MYVYAFNIFAGMKDVCRLLTLHDGRKRQYRKLWYVILSGAVLNLTAQ